MKNVYLFQPNYKYGNSAHLPYAVGTIAAYAWSIEEIKNNYELKDIYFLRESISDIINKIENPDVVGFSSYLWNWEYNKKVAKTIKSAFPDCVIIFGGHHVSQDDEILRENEYIDIAIHSEGEVIFSSILLALLHNEDLNKIPNISFRKNKTFINTITQPVCDCSDFPSPYLTGQFDKIIKNNPDIEFQMLFETNRGCAYHCAYCDWGALNSKLRLFPIERIHRELDWMCEKKIDFCGNADANFGILERDVELIDYIIQLKKSTGYPKKFQASYAKNSDERVFEISKKLQENNMNKGITLAFQTMSTDAAKIVGRSNISIDKFEKLMKRYNKLGIPTYTELILGLPGETYKTFSEGINRLLCAGQHHSIYVHNCELLPCSEMGSYEYTEKYKIKTNRVSLNQPHMPVATDEIPEFSTIVTQTFSMTSEEWVKTNLFSCVVQAFHHLGLLEFVSIYVHYENRINYDEFYERLIEYLINEPNTIAGLVISKIKNSLCEILEDKGSLTLYDARFGDVIWPFEEYCFLAIIYEKERFYKEIKDFLKNYIVDNKILVELLNYQQIMIKHPICPNKKYRFQFDFYNYFNNIFSGKYQKIENNVNLLKINSKEKNKDWPEFAKRIVWYGRKDSKNVYTEETEVEYL